MKLDSGGARGWGDGATLPRHLGVRGSAPGTLLIVVAGLHGNEPAGVEALRRVFADLERRSMSLRGRMVGLVGNVAALSEGRRFLDEDLNRIWTAETFRRVGADPASASRDAAELIELAGAIETEVERGPWDSVVLVDLHTTSADSPPFCIIGDTLQNRRVAFGWPVPVLIGLEETIRGTIQEYFGERGLTTAALEGGRHDDPHSADRLESGLWLVLASTGLIAAADAGGLTEHRRRMSGPAAHLPRVVEVFHRHGLGVGEDFEMVPGYRNFSAVGRGETVAHSGGRPVRAVSAGLLLLPRYQPAGDDGYFLGRAVPRVWLAVSTAMRHLRAERVLRCFPGVKSVPGDPRTLHVDGRIARWRVVELFHLCGFRRLPSRGGVLRFRRRREGPL